MDLSPRSPRNIQESSSSSSSELQPFINVDDNRSLQGQDEISALELQQRLHDCREEQIFLRNDIRVLQELVENSGMRLQQLEDGTSMNVTRRRMCLEEEELKKRECVALEFSAKVTQDQVEHYKRLDRLQNEQTALLSAQLESLERHNSTITNRLRRADLKAKALSEEIENLKRQLLEESDCPPTS